VTTAIVEPISNCVFIDICRYATFLSDFCQSAFLSYALVLACIGFCAMFLALAFCSRAS